MKVPSFLLRRLYAKGSLRNTDNGFQFELKNQLTPDREGDWTVFFPEDEVTSIFEAGEKYQDKGIPTIVIAGNGPISTQMEAAKAILCKHFFYTFAGIFSSVPEMPLYQKRTVIRICYTDYYII